MEFSFTSNQKPKIKRSVSLRNYKVCDGCSITGRDMSICEVCSKWMCPDCINNHQKNCTDKEPIHETQEPLLPQLNTHGLHIILKDTKEQFMKIRDKLKDESNNTSEQFREVQKIASNVLQRINTEEEEVIVHVKKHFSGLKEQFHCDVNEINELLKSKFHISSKIEPIQDQTEELHVLSEDIWINDTQGMPQEEELTENSNDSKYEAEKCDATSYMEDLLLEIIKHRIPENFPGIEQNNDDGPDRLLTNNQITCTGALITPPSSENESDKLIQTTITEQMPCLKVDSGYHYEIRISQEEKKFQTPSVQKHSNDPKYEAATSYMEESPEITEHEIHKVLPENQHNNDDGPEKLLTNNPITCTSALISPPSSENESDKPIQTTITEQMPCLKVDSGYHYEIRIPQEEKKFQTTSVQKHSNDPKYEAATSYMEESPEITKHGIHKLLPENQHNNDDGPEILLTNNQITCTSALISRYKENKSDQPIIPKIQERMPSLKLDTDYAISRSAYLEGPVWKLYPHDNEIWCLCSGSVQIFTKDCSLLRRIYLQNVTNARSVAITESGNLIVATSNQGVQLMNSDGNFLGLVHKGKFSDCSIINNQKLYALKYDESKLFVFDPVAINDREEWKIVKHIKLGYLKGSQFDTLLVRDDHLYICSWNNNCFYLFKQEGVLLELYATYEVNKSLGPLNGPRICSVDDNGNCLIADSNNEKLLTFNERGEMAEVCDIDGEVYDAVVSQDYTTVWAVTDKSNISSDVEANSRLIKLDRKST